MLCVCWCFYVAYIRNAVSVSVFNSANIEVINIKNAYSKKYLCIFPPLNPGVLD